MEGQGLSFLMMLSLNARLASMLYQYDLTMITCAYYLSASMEQA